MARVPELTPELEAALRRLVAQPAIDRTIERPKKARRGVGGDITVTGSSLIPVIIQTDLLDDEPTILVKNTDSNGAEFGDAYEVYVLPNYATIEDKTDYVPWNIGGEPGLVSTDIHGKKILIRPDIQLRGFCE